MRLAYRSRSSTLALLTVTWLTAQACGGVDSPFEARRPSDDADSGAGGGGASAGSGGAATGGRSSGGRGSTGGASTGTGGGSPSGGGASTGGGAADGGASGGAPGAGGGSAAGGASGAGGAPACPDADGDGQTTCAGDCDDADPDDFTGNSEYCGDARDNDCDNQADEGCGGLGTYVSSDIGDDGDPGTQAEPVRTIGQGMLNAQAVGGKTPVFIAGGHYSEKVTLVEGVSLLGGYDCSSASCTWARDRIAYDSAILNVDEEGVLATDSITRTTRVDGLRIQGMNGSGVGRGRVAMTLRGGSPTLSNNRINGPNVTSGGFLVGRSMALLILSPSNDTAGPLVENNVIVGGQASDASFAILMESASSGAGSTYALIRRNTVRGGRGTSGHGITAWTSGSGTKVQDNDIFAGTATTSGGSAFGINVGSQMEIDSNRVNVGSGSGTCPSGSTSFCGGLNSLSSTTTITNNVIFGIDAPLSVGVRLMEAEVAGGVVQLNANHIDGGGGSSGGSRSAAVVVQIGSCTTCGFNGRIGRIRNNTLAGGSASQRYALYEEAPAGRTQHPEALENNDLFVSAPLGVSDALYRGFDGANGVLVTTIGAVNTLSTPIPALVVGGNLAADPMVNASFHLQSGSPCANAGTATEAPALDMDGETRPRGTAVDIGPDEAQ